MKDLHPILIQELIEMIRKNPPVQNETSCKSGYLSSKDIRRIFQTAVKHHPNDAILAKEILSRLYTDIQLKGYQLTYLDRLYQRYGYWQHSQYWQYLREKDCIQRVSNLKLLISDEELKKAQNNMNIALMQLDDKIDQLFWDTLKQITLADLQSLFMKNIQ